MMDKSLAERAWNAALDHVDEELSFADSDIINNIEELKAPSSHFDEWWEREVVNPPEGIESWGN